jgi:hypothetical protein
MAGKVPAVQFISNNGVADRSKVNPDLVGATRFGTALD